MASKEPKILTAQQVSFLDIVSSEPYLCENYYFTGGTPLAAFYLFHRLSEDIDLFSEAEVNLESIRVFMKKAQKRLNIKKIDYRQFYGLHTFQLFFSSKHILKVDFNYYPFSRIEPGTYYKNLQVDSIYDIAVNKAQTIGTKPRARDFIDLYFIIKKTGYTLSRLLAQAKAKFDWNIDTVQLGSRLLDASKVSDYPRMIMPIEDKEWKNFFVNEAEKLDGKVFK